MPFVRDPRQAAQAGPPAGRPRWSGHATQPWRLVGPAVSILRSKGSRGILDALALEEVPTFVLHGDRDLIVPSPRPESAAKRANGQLVTVKRGGHSWLLRDPETLPAIVAELLEGRLGDAIRAAIGAAGAVSTDELEADLLRARRPVLALEPRPGTPVDRRAAPATQLPLDDHLTRRLERG